MPQSLANVAVHLVFSTKDRRPYLADEETWAEMHKQLGGTSKTLDCPPSRRGAWTITCICWGA